MPIRHSVWTVDKVPKPLSEGILPSEQFLEDMIVAAPEILSDQWMIIGRQEITGTGGRIDLLALAPDGALILIELKRANGRQRASSLRLNVAPTRQRGEPQKRQLF